MCSTLHAVCWAAGCLTTVYPLPRHPALGATRRQTPDKGGECMQGCSNMAPMFDREGGGGVGVTQPWENQRNAAIQCAFINAQYAWAGQHKQANRLNSTSLKLGGLCTCKMPHARQSNCWQQQQHRSNIAKQSSTLTLLWSDQVCIHLQQQCRQLVNTDEAAAAPHAKECTAQHLLSSE